MPGMTLGGQAVLEGVMIRAPGVMTIAVRRQDGVIVIRNDRLERSADKSRIIIFPLIRGIIVVWQSILLGFRALLFSSSISAGIVSESLDQEPDLTSLRHSRFRSHAMTAIGLILVLLTALGLFMLLPFFTAVLCVDRMLFLNIDPVWRNFIEGLIRLAIPVAYILVISMVPEIRRVFQYHGAEHMSIHAFEAGLDLTTENARRFSRFHPNCGTAMLFLVIVISWITFSLIPVSLSFAHRALLRVSLIPVIIGIAYEIVRIFACSRNRLIRSFLGLLSCFQFLTTRKPDEDQIEVGLAALKAAIAHSNEG